MVVKISRLARAIPMTALAVAALGAHAQAAPDSMFTFSGFATIGVVSTDTDDAHFVISGQPHGATKKASGEVDSKLGGQVNAKFNKVFSGTVQLLSKQNGEGSWTPELEWAFVKAQVTPSLGFRIGRMGAPFFAVSDFRDVGYANTWLRPPQDVYGQVPVSHFDGADALFQTELGSATLTFQPFFGQSKAKFEHVDVRFKKLVGINVTAELDNGLTLRAGHAQGKLNVDSATLDGLVAVLRTTPFASVGDQLSARDKDASFTGIGVAYDQHNVVINAEFTKRRTSSYVPDTTGAYITGGYRFGKWLPYGIWSKLKQDDSNVVNTIPAGVPQLAVLRATVDGTLQLQSNRQKTWGAGVRWDAWRNVAVKAQYENIRPDGPGLFTQPTAAFGQKKVNVYSVAVDLVF